MTSFHASSFFGTVNLTVFGSIPANQQRSQLSSAYWTTSRNGGDVTTSEMELLRIFGVAAAGVVSKRDFAATLASVFRVAESQSPKSCRDFFKITFTTSRGGGVWFRLALIFSCDFTETA